ncbi:AUGMIN subunit 5 [Olea europaea subsp. europaea]|uniref:AUGMIN subunit 5 n=1 Tax=Olea europaea subsp. europaea TaxID=158383 RepID=A0A8S0QNN0_OLEEU|nr:AUGMIN subunit 5 [Olea europaea subsp. europaea]
MRMTQEWRLLLLLMEAHHRNISFMEMVRMEVMLCPECCCWNVTKYEQPQTAGVNIHSVVAAAFWSQQPLASRKYASSTIIPACNVVVDLSNNAKDLIDNELFLFPLVGSYSFLMCPLISDSGIIGVNGCLGSKGPKAVATAERNATVLIARTGARDPSVVPYMPHFCCSTISCWNLSRVSMHC